MERGENDRERERVSEKRGEERWERDVERWRKEENERDAESERV